MAWYYGTFNCGHEGRVNVVGPTKNRQWIADRKFEGLCPECYEEHLLEEREKVNTEAAEKAKEMELPELVGSEKQVAWANTLRQKLIDKVESKLVGIEERKGNKTLANKIFNFILTTKVEARWFIDNRFEFEDVETLFRRVKDEIKTEDEIVEEKTELEVKAECIVYPENKITESVAEIEIKGDKVSSKFEKDDKFKEIVKSLSFKWNNGAWERTINNLTGSSNDRAAELGNKLLNSGFPIMIMDAKIRNNAVNGIFEVECNRWITLRMAGDYAGCMAIKWWEDNDRLYKTARKLPGSRWNSKSVVIKIEHYKDVEEFARLYDFKFTEKALKTIEDYKKISENIPVVKPAKIEEVKPKDGLLEILNSGSDILDDLKD